MGVHEPVAQTGAETGPISLRDIVVQQEWVLHQLITRGSPIPGIGHALGDKRLSVPAEDVGGGAHVAAVADVEERRHGVEVGQRRFGRRHFDHRHAQRPHIRLRAAALAPDHLGGHPVR